MQKDTEHQNEVGAIFKKRSDCLRRLHFLNFHIKLRVRINARSLHVTITMKRLRDLNPSIKLRPVIGNDRPIKG